MKKFGVISILMAVLILSSCGNGNKTILKFPTAATSGAIYPLGASLSNLWSKEIQGVTVNVEASNGGIQNLVLLSEGEAQIGVAVSSIAYEQQQGTGVFEGKSYDGVRVLSALYYNPNQIMVTKNSGIDKISDMKGKKIATGAPGSTTEVEANVHITAAGLTYPKDINVQYVGFTESIDLMRNRQLEGCFIMSGVPTSAVAEILTTANGKILSVDEEIINSLVEKYPWYTRYVIPANTYDRQEEEVVTTAIRMLLLCDESVDEDVAYQLVKTFWENIVTLSSDHKALSGVKIENAVSDTAGIPIHKGAERYYREKGVIE